MVASTVTPFVRPNFSALKQDGKEPIRSLLDLIRFNANVNPENAFCLQAETDPSGGQWRVRDITFKDLYLALGNCCSWLSDRRVVGPDYPERKQSPVAVYLESDVSLFIYVNALTASNCPVVLLSARLSADNVSHLLRATGAKHVLVSKKTRRAIEGALSEDVHLTTVARYPELLQQETNGATLALADQRLSQMAFDENDTEVIILHSSGTTGQPKPIRLGHRYLLGYAACHAFREEESPTWPNLSTLPLYHGFGMLAPGLSLSLGMTCCFPPSATVPGAHSTVELLTVFRARSLMSVPSIMEDIVSLASDERSQALSALATLNFVAIGGGPLKPSVAEALHDGAVNLLNHYGATEIGAIAPIFIPGSDYDWHYLRLRRDLNLELRPVHTESQEQGEARYKLVGHPFGWNIPFEIQDEIEKRPGFTNGHLDIRILGRRDDLIVLRTGEKVSPQPIEESLVTDPYIKSAVCLGDGSFELLVLIEPSSFGTMDNDKLKQHVWNLLRQINTTLDSHARISSQEAIIIKPPNKTIPRSDKGSVMRREAIKLFEEEIAVAQKNLDAASFGEGLSIDPTNIEASIIKAVETAMSEKLRGHLLSSDQDFFEFGMDSLEATRLARALTSILSSLPSGTQRKVTRDSIYRNPTINRLLSSLLGQEAPLVTSAELVSRKARIESLAHEYLRLLPRQEASVLLTGSTGNLGVHFLSQLVKDQRVGHVHCVNRSGSLARQDVRERLQEASRSAGVEITPSEWEKISFLEADMQAPSLGLTDGQYTSIVNSVTHIVHLAWPMDFNRKLESYRPQLDALRGLIKLACDANLAQPTLKPKLLFASSISVVRHYADRTGRHIVPEESLRDPEVSAQMGYAEAKYICEQMLEHSTKTLHNKLSPINVRIGQLSGPENTRGVWKTGEHIPELLKTSQQVAAFPALEGNFSWLPVDRAARSLTDILFHQPVANTLHYHLENPVRQPLADLGSIAVRELGLKEGIIPWNSWLEKVADIAEDASLLNFFREDFQSLANGSITLDTQVSRAASRSLRGSSGLSKDLVADYIQRWREMGFLN